MCITKTLSLIVNGVLLASGAALFIVAIVVNEVNLKYLGTEKVDLDWIVMLLSIAGAIAAASAISGLVGACCCEIKYLLYLSLVLVVAVFVMEVVFVVKSSVSTVEKFDDYMDKDAVQNMASYRPNSTAKTEWDNFQSHGECCGSNGPTDWLYNRQQIPQSCCKNKGTCDTSDNKNIFTQGCNKVIKESFLKSMDVLRGTTYAMLFVHAGAGAFEVIMIIKALACGCCCCI